jgi:hypothetical protein
MQIALIGCIAVLLLLLSVSLYFNYKHGVIIITLVDAVEDSLSVLDEKEESISRILEIPLFYDSPQVRQVHNDIIDCRDSILSIAYALGNADMVETVAEEEQGLAE